MYDRILVGTDGSGPSNRAVTHALELAEQFGAQLHGMFVVDTDRFAEPALSSLELETNAVEEWGNEQLHEVVERGESVDVDVVTRSCHGKPYQEIIKYGDDIDADLIVLGYHGHSHAGSGQLGSVTDRVVENAGRPVLVV